MITEWAEGRSPVIMHKPLFVIMRKPLFVILHEVAWDRPRSMWEPGTG